MNPIVLDDWMTTPEHPFNSKITECGDEVVHSHRFYEIFYILEGSISHTLNGEGHILHAGNMVFLNLADVHSFNWEEGNTCKHRDIIIHTDFFDSICSFKAISSLETKSFLPCAYCASWMLAPILVPLLPI